MPQNGRDDTTPVDMLMSPLIDDLRPPLPPTAAPETIIPAPPPDGPDIPGPPPPEPESDPEPGEIE